MRQPQGENGASSSTFLEGVTRDRWCSKKRGTRLPRSSRQHRLATCLLNIRVAKTPRLLYHPPHPPYPYMLVPCHLPPPASSTATSRLLMDSSRPRKLVTTIRQAEGRMRVGIPDTDKSSRTFIGDREHVYRDANTLPTRNLDPLYFSAIT